MQRESFPAKYYCKSSVTTWKSINIRYSIISDETIFCKVSWNLIIERARKVSCLRDVFRNFTGHLGVTDKNGESHWSICLFFMHPRFCNTNFNTILQNVLFIHRSWSTCAFTTISCTQTLRTWTCRPDAVWMFYSLLCVFVMEF